MRVCKSIPGIVGDACSLLAGRVAFVVLDWKGISECLQSYDATNLCMVPVSSRGVLGRELV